MPIFKVRRPILRECPARSAHRRPARGPAAAARRSPRRTPPPQGTARGNDRGGGRRHRGARGDDRSLPRQGRGGQVLPPRRDRGRAGARGRCREASCWRRRAWLRAHKMTRLKFGTSPLLTRNAWLYITRFGSRYRWREGARTPDGRPWPYVSCECDFDDPLAHPLDLREDQVPQRSVLHWKDGRPDAARRPGVLRAACPSCCRTWTATPSQRRQAGPRVPRHPLLRFPRPAPARLRFCLVRPAGRSRGRTLVLRHEKGRDFLIRVTERAIAQPRGKGLHSAAWTLRRRSS